jgi:hypothetical protein
MARLTRRQAMAAAALAGAGAGRLAGKAEAAAGGKAGEELPAFRYPMESQLGRVTKGGSARRRRRTSSRSRRGWAACRCA